MNSFKTHPVGGVLLQKIAETIMAPAFIIGTAFWLILIASMDTKNARRGSGSVY